VLVCPYTNPSWTPLFQRCAAVVVDSGGAASHAAIIAREHGIPAIIGTARGTAELTDGQIVVVDGSTGRVTPGRAGPLTDDSRLAAGVPQPRQIPHEPTPALSAGRTSWHGCAGAGADGQDHPRPVAPGPPRSAPFLGGLKLALVGVDEQLHE
jgi:hypothetical protein